MAEVKGKFIIMAAAMMANHIMELAEADDALHAATGKHWCDMKREEWYDTSIFDIFIRSYAKSMPDHDRAIVDLGKRVYATIEETTGLPENIKKSPLDFIRFEGEGFLMNHRGDGVVPRKYIVAESGHVIVEAKAPGYPSRLYEGVYRGILEMCAVRNALVTQTKSIERGDDTDEFELRW